MTMPGAHGHRDPAIAGFLDVLDAMGASVERQLAFKSAR